MNRYAIIVFWSEDDGAWVADVPDLRILFGFRRHPRGSRGRSGNCDRGLACRGA